MSLYKDTKNIIQYCRDSVSRAKTPLLKAIPVDRECPMPYGLLHSPSPTVRGMRRK